MGIEETKFQLVSADTITAITTSRDFYPQGAPPAPSPEELIEGIDRRLAEKAARGRENREERISAGRRLTRAFNRVVNAAERDLKEFRKLVNNPPPGFRFAVAWYAPPQNGRVKFDPVLKDYSARVEAQALKYCAANHADELKALGICQHGIAQMAMGMQPLNTDFYPYDVIFDHIIERAGSGAMGEKKARDPGRPDARRDVFLANHLGNLILMPGAVHKLKNKLHRLQGTQKKEVRIPRFVLTLAPVRDAKHSGFVCAPQPGGLETRPKNVHNGISRLKKLARHTMNVVWAFRQNPAVEGFLAGFRALAAKKGRTVAELAAFEGTAAQRRHGFGPIFNHVISVHDEDARQAADKTVRPALREVAMQLAELAEAATCDDTRRATRKHHMVFATAFRSRAMRNLRTVVDGLPFREAAELKAAFHATDDNMALAAARLRKQEERRREIRHERRRHRATGREKPAA